MTTLNPKIVIVGCGISGVAAADRLLKAGFQNVHIVEATKRSGGRIKTSTSGIFVIKKSWHLTRFILNATFVACFCLCRKSP